MAGINISANADTDIRLKEANHRIKNSLQLACSLKYPDTCLEAELFQASSRIASIAKVHDRLSRTDNSRVDVAAYLRELCADLTSSLSLMPGQSVRVMATHTLAPADFAVSLGPIVTELVTNALKHAYRDGTSGKIQVAFIPLADGTLQLTIADKGIGLPKVSRWPSTAVLACCFSRIFAIVLKPTWRLTARHQGRASHFACHPSSRRRRAQLSMLRSRDANCSDCPARRKRSAETLWRHRALMSSASWAGTVYHGLPKDSLAFRRETEHGFLAFLGRICPEKRPDRAIEIANRCKLPLKIAAKVDRCDEDYWGAIIRPMMETSPLVEFVGEIDESRKSAFLGDARALLFPIDWPEPFGLAMIEAMACGTPVIGWPAGSVPEIVDDGVSGFIVTSLEDAIHAVGRLPLLKRATVRATFNRRFIASRMAQDYVRIYQTVARPSRTLDIRKRAAIAPTTGYSSEAGK
jgi:two-component sensor histidine kinase